MNEHPLLLLILDGWGIAPNSPYNAITQAKTPQWDQWCRRGLFIPLDASGSSVGLPHQQMGNSEVGHMHIGAGRLIKQDYTHITEQIQDGQFFKNPILLQALARVKAHQGTVHLLGLVSDGGVHSHQQHLFALLELLDRAQLNEVMIHAFLDGRDTPPQHATQCIKELQNVLEESSSATLASLTGRFYAMDRDNRWERIEAAYQLLTENQNVTLIDPCAYLDACYQEGITDEFVPPTALQGHRPIHDNDLVIFFNFRADRARQLSRALTEPQFTGFTRNKAPHIELVTMTQYAEDIKATVVYPPQSIINTLGECVAKAHQSQLRIAETEKYAHVTFFFNGGQEQPFEHEQRILINSPKVKTYDLKPEMSAYEMTEALVEALHSHRYQLIVCNFANADMVGHTGNFAATVKAIEALDNCFNAIDKALITVNGRLLVTADHGNAEKMFDEHKAQAHTAHTCEPVPFIYLGQEKAVALKSTGDLTDIAPTVLSLLDLPIPSEMTGSPLLKLLSY